MDTQSLSHAIDKANQAKAQQTNDMIVGVVVVVFALFVIIVFSAVLASVLKQKADKCPKCGNWKRNKSAMQTIQSGDTSTTRKIIVCAKCGHEHSA